MNLHRVILVFSFFSAYCVFSQPYVDLININNQHVQTNYVDSFGGNEKINNFAVNLTVPIKLDSQNTIILRLFTENLVASTDIGVNERVPFTNVVSNQKLSYVTSLYATILPIGLQRESKNKKWKYLVLAMPKVAGTLGEKVSSYNFQPGVFALVTHKYSDKLSIKGGLFYNKEFFGNFLVPIISADWTVSDRFKMYGTFPTFYKFEYAIKKQVLYAGLNYRSYTRSFLLSGTEHNYMRIDDMSVKAFVDVYIKKNIVLYAEFGRMINYSLLDYKYNTKRKPENEITNSVVYRTTEIPFFFNIGMAYRLRFDFDK
jgi:hypothetical protein